jgi:hypothetical protein
MSGVRFLFFLNALIVTCSKRFYAASILYFSISELVQWQEGESAANVRLQFCYGRVQHLLMVASIEIFNQRCAPYFLLQIMHFWRQAKNKLDFEPGR